MATNIATTTYAKARFIDTSLEFKLDLAGSLTRGVNVVSVEPGKLLAKYAGLHAVSPSFVHKARLSTWVFLWAWDREAYFSRPITFLTFGIERGDYVTISLSTMDSGVVIAVGI